MDKLITTERERFWNPEAYIRDQWVKAEAAKLGAGSRVLDAGAGASKYRPFFEHCRYETQDFCQYQGPLVKYVQSIDHVCDITAIPLEDASLDAVLCTEVIEHVVDPPAVLGEFARLLKPGGRLLLTAPLLSHLHMEPFHYFGGFTHHWYRHWLPRRGFAIESITPVGGPAQTCVIFCQAFYTQWSLAEGRLPAPGRWLSLGFRMGAKVIVHGLLPRILPKLDPWLGSGVVCSGYLVAGVRDREKAN